MSPFLFSSIIEGGVVSSKLLGSEVILENVSDGALEGIRL